MKIKEDNKIIWISVIFIEYKILCNLSKNLTILIVFQGFRLLYETSYYVSCFVYVYIYIHIKFCIKIDAISTYERNFNNKNNGTLKFYVS